MTPTNSVPISSPGTAPAASYPLHALDHAPWLEIRDALRKALLLRQLGALQAPLTLALHELLDRALKTLHLQVFRHILEASAGISLETDDEQLLALYRAEIGEHGIHNIAQACQEGGWQLGIDFPSPSSGADCLLRIDAPFPWSPAQGRYTRLLTALGFRLQVETIGDACRVTLLRAGGHAADLPPPRLMVPPQDQSSLGQLFAQLDYGLIQFSAAGNIVAASPSMLRRLRLNADDAALRLLAAAIPPLFHNDVIWGLAQGEGNGAFENYRIRISLPEMDGSAILFNVSGFCDGDGLIHSLWQSVSQDEGGSSLAEGSMLSEVRIHNITRNYVPQLVEQKARDAVRLGKSSLSNEEREVAVLFCDIVGFTSYVERHAGSESVINTLNSILRRVSGSVTRHQGSIDKFMGDCVMALFDDPADSIVAAIDMQSHSEDINNLRNRAGQQALQLRIGIHWGAVVIGNVGTSERLDWTAIGDVVNTASRIEKGCQPGAILVSQALRDAIAPTHGNRFRFGPRFGLQVKGKRDELTVCHVSPADK